MKSEVVFIFLGILMVFHLPIAYFASRELLDYPLWKNNRKIVWLFIVWLTPIIGSVLVHRKLGLVASGTESSGGGTILDPGSGGSGDCGGGGDGGC